MIRDYHRLPDYDAYHLLAYSSFNFSLFQARSSFGLVASWAPGLLVAYELAYYELRFGVPEKTIGIRDDDFAMETENVENRKWKMGRKKKKKKEGSSSIRFGLLHWE